MWSRKLKWSRPNFLLDLSFGQCYPGPVGWVHFQFPGPFRFLHYLCVRVNTLKLTVYSWSVLTAFAPASTVANRWRVLLTTVNLCLSIRIVDNSGGCSWSNWAVLFLWSPFLKKIASLFCSIGVQILDLTLCAVFPLPLELPPARDETRCVKGGRQTLAVGLTKIGAYQDSAMPPKPPNHPNSAKSRCPGDCPHLVKLLHFSLAGLPGMRPRGWGWYTASSTASSMSSTSKLQEMWVNRSTMVNHGQPWSTPQRAIFFRDLNVQLPCSRICSCYIMWLQTTVSKPNGFAHRASGQALISVIIGLRSLPELGTCAFGVGWTSLRLLNKQSMHC